MEKGGPEELRTREHNVCKKISRFGRLMRDV